MILSSILDSDFRILVLFSLSRVPGGCRSEIEDLGEPGQGP